MYPSERPASLMIRHWTLTRMEATPKFITPFMTSSQTGICEESDRKGIPFLQSTRREDWFNNIDLHAVVQRDLRMVEIHPHQFIAYGPADRISAVDRSQPEKFIEFVDCSVPASDSEIAV